MKKPRVGVPVAVFSYHFLMIHQQAAAFKYPYSIHQHAYNHQNRRHIHYYYYNCCQRVPQHLKQQQSSRQKLTTSISLQALDNQESENQGEHGISHSSWPSTILHTITSDPKRSIIFSLSQTLAGATLGPFLDSYHSIFGVLQYDCPLSFQLWSSSTQFPALVTTYWVPFLFGLAGFIIGWLYILLDSIFQTYHNLSNDTSAEQAKSYTPTNICLGISFFTFQYWLSGILYYYNIDRTIILSIMTICAYFGYKSLDNTKAGLITSAATAIGGPLIEVGLISYFLNLHNQGISSTFGYHYTDTGETGFFPLWIIPVYFLGGPANGNLARGVWDAVKSTSSTTSMTLLSKKSSRAMGCTVCNDSRAVSCPNCDGVGYYMSYNREVKCNCCKGRGLVICRNCFDSYGEDPSDIQAIREMMSRIPD